MIPINTLDLSILVKDPRLISAGHSGQRLMVCEPTLSGNVCLDDVKTGFYGDYRNIRGGNILYYADPDLMQPFISYGGLFPHTANVSYEEYVDPNGIRKVQYRRNIPNNGNGCLSFVRDTNNVRAELLAANMWRRNQQNGFMM